MTALTSKTNISGSPSRATANAGFGDLWEFIDERLSTGDGTAAEKAATRAALEAARGIQPVTASVGSNALTLTLNPTNLDFRSATLTSGTVNTRTVSAAINVVISSGSTLGTSNGVAARIAILAIDNAGTVELAAVNADGGFHFNETALISTTAEGGAGAADSSSVVYSTTARSNVAWRLVGFIEITETTAGTWATAATKIQGVGGIADRQARGVSMIRVNTANGYGSTNDKIRRFTTTVTSLGSDISYADSASAGGSFTINTPGIYAMSYTDFFSAGGDLGISVDSAQLTTAIGSITAANRVAESSTTAASVRGTAMVTMFLAAGSVVRAHTAGSAGGGSNTQFTITRVA